MASTCSTFAPIESIHFENLEFIVINDGEPRSTADTPTDDDTPQVMPDQQLSSPHEQANHLRTNRTEIATHHTTQKGMATPGGCEAPR
jgi:hypothetical protein